MKFESFKISFTVPESHADSVREAMGNAGAGRVGNYSHCSFSIKGQGRFKPGNGANPFIGTIGELEKVDEELIEVNCSGEQLAAAIEAIKRAHPYEEPVIDVYPLFC